jgi:hypothetical protein
VTCCTPTVGGHPAASSAASTSLWSSVYAIDYTAQPGTALASDAVIAGVPHTIRNAANSAGTQNVSGVGLRIATAAGGGIQNIVEWLGTEVDAPAFSLYLPDVYAAAGRVYPEVTRTRLVCEVDALFSNSVNSTLLATVGFIVGTRVNPTVISAPFVTVARGVDSVTTSLVAMRTTAQPTVFGSRVFGPVVGVTDWSRGSLMVESSQGWFRSWVAGPRVAGAWPTDWRLVGSSRPVIGGDANIWPQGGQQMLSLLLAAERNESGGNTRTAQNTVRYLEVFERSDELP